MTSITAPAPASVSSPASVVAAIEAAIRYVKTHADFYFFPVTRNFRNTSHGRTEEGSIMIFVVSRGDLLSTLSHEKKWRECFIVENGVLKYSAMTIDKAYHCFGRPISCWATELNSLDELPLDPIKHTRAFEWEKLCTVYACKNVFSFSPNWWHTGLEKGKKYDLINEIGVTGECKLPGGMLGADGD